MSTSFIYHALGLSGYEYAGQKFHAGCVIFHVRPKWCIVRCPVCKSREVVRKGCCIRKLRTVPVGRKPIWLEVEIPRIFCRKCNCVRQINTVIAQPRKSYTRSFARYVIALSKVMTLKDIAALLGTGWDLVKGIVKTRLARCFSKPPLRNVRYIAIDETSIRKGYKYITIVLDLEKGNVLFVGDGKGSEALMPFWQRVRKSKCQILAVSTDLGSAYISATLDNLPGVPLVFDRFHVVKLMNDVLTETRRGLYRGLKDVMRKDVLKGSRWILLKNPGKLSIRHNEEARLKEALELTAPLATAYYMKEDLRQFWEQPDRETAEKVISDWVERASKSGIGPLMKMGNTIAAHKLGILNWYDYPVSSGRLGGTNNKIKVLKRMAYGYRDQEFFKLRIMAIHEAKYAFTG